MKADRERQLLLAKERLANRRRRKANGEEENQNYEESPTPADGTVCNSSFCYFPARN